MTQYEEAYRQSVYRGPAESNTWLSGRRGMATAPPEFGEVLERAVLEVCAMIGIVLVPV